MYSTFITPQAQRSTLFPTRRSSDLRGIGELRGRLQQRHRQMQFLIAASPIPAAVFGVGIVIASVAQYLRADALRSLHQDRKGTRLNSSHPSIPYAVFCLKKKNHDMT